MYIHYVLLATKCLIFHFFIGMSDISMEYIEAAYLCYLHLWFDCFAIGSFFENFLLICLLHRKCFKMYWIIAKLRYRMEWFQCLLCIFYIHFVYSVMSDVLDTCWALIGAPCCLFSKLLNDFLEKTDILQFY
jgi:hypothetical protein